jgi:hypothetical protein
VNGVLKELNGPVFDEVNTEDRTTSAILGAGFVPYKPGIIANYTVVDFSAVESVEGEYFDVAKPFSFACWVKVDSVAAGSTTPIWGNRDGNPGTTELGWYNTAGEWYLRFRTFTGALRAVDSSSLGASWPSGDEIFIVCTYDPTLSVDTWTDRAKIYVNGSDDTNKDASVGLPATMSNATWFYGGRPDLNGGSNIIKDQFCAWSKAIDSTLVTTMWNGGSGMAY